MSDFNPFSLTSKTILVTGASSGIGRAVAIACSKMGARLVLLGRNKQKLEATLGLLAGDGHMTLAADLTERGTFVRMTDTLPALDGIVHCAGIGQRALCKQLTEQDVEAKEAEESQKGRVYCLSFLHCCLLSKYWACRL